MFAPTISFDQKVKEILWTQNFIRPIIIFRPNTCFGTGRLPLETRDKAFSKLNTLDSSLASTLNRYPTSVISSNMRIRNTVATIKSEEHVCRHNSDITYLKTPAIQNEHIFDNPRLIAKIAIIACLSAYKCNLILPKYRASGSLDIGDQVMESLNQSYEVYDNFFYLCLFLKNQEQIPRGRQCNGTRSKKILGSLRVKDLILEEVPLSRVAHFKRLESPRIT